MTRADHARASRRAHQLGQHGFARRPLYRACEAGHAYVARPICPSAGSRVGGKGPRRASSQGAATNHPEHDALAYPSESRRRPARASSRLRPLARSDGCESLLGDPGALAPSSGRFDLSIHRARATFEGLAAARQALQNHSKINLSLARPLRSRGCVGARSGSICGRWHPPFISGASCGCRRRRRRRRSTGHGVAPAGALMTPSR